MMKLWCARSRNDQEREPRRNRDPAFWLKRAVLAVFAASLLVAAIVWWRDRPLAAAEASLAQGDVKYAHYVVSRYLDRHPRDPRAMALQARVFVALDQPDAAITLFDQAGADTVEDLRAWARALLMTEQWSLAVPLLQRIVEMRPDDADALYELTASRVRLGQFEQALESARRFAAIPGQEARGHLFIGAILHDLSKNAEAADAYRKVLEHDPKAENLQTPAADFFLQYGQVLLLLGKPEESLEPLKLSAAERETPEVLLELGNAAFQLGRVEHARTAWKRVLELNELNVEAREALAEAALLERDPQTAIEWLAPLGEGNATLQSAYLRQRAYALLGDRAQEQKWQSLALERRRQKEFRGEIDELLRDAPNSFWAKVVRAHRFAEQGNWRQAELLVGPLLEQSPAEPFVVELAAAVRHRRDLPPLESLPKGR